MIDIEKIKRKLALSAIKGEFTVGITSKNAADLYNQIIQSKRSNKKFNNDLLSEIPFEIPINWIWCNLCNIASIVVGATPSTANRDYWENGDIYWIPSGCCHDCVVTKESRGIKTITQKGYDNCSTTLMQPNTTLIALTGATAGRIGYLTFEACANQSVVGILADKLINPRYVYYSFFARKNEILGDCVGSAQPHFSKDYVTKMIFPLPPVEIQNVIVAKLDEIFAELDKIDADQNKLAKLQEKLQDKLLETAIRGKLVEQRPEEGTGEELFKQIQAEKQELVKLGKIKKEKPFAEITEDDIPFEIPSSWKWVRLGELGDSVNNSFADGPFGSNLKKEHYTKNKEVRIIQLSNIGENGWKNNNEKYTTFAHLETIKRSEVDFGNIVIAKMMPAGRAIIVPNLGTKFVLSSDCVKFVPHKFLLPLFYCYAINSAVFNLQVLSEINGIGRERTSLSKLKSYLIPLPPYEEQKRIVIKLNELLSFCRKQ